MKALTIIKAGSTFSTTRQRLGDFEDWVIRASGLSDTMVSGNFSLIAGNI